MHALSILLVVSHSKAVPLLTTKAEMFSGMRYGLMRLGEHRLPDQLEPGEQSFLRYISDQKRNIMSNFDGGQIAFNFRLGGKTLFWNAHLGAYSGILQNLQPKPGTAISQVSIRSTVQRN